MCMKKHRTYRPKGLSKDEQKYLNSMVRREIIMSIVTLLAGIAIVIAIFALTKQAAGV